MNQSTSNLQLFSYKDKSFRVLFINNDHWWILNEVCEVLNISNSRNVSERLDRDEKDVYRMDSPGGKQGWTIINESGLYSVILRSDKPEAKRFKKWITSEVLPQIRRTGSYLSPIAQEQQTQLVVDKVLEQITTVLVPSIIDQCTASIEENLIGSTNTLAELKKMIVALHSDIKQNKCEMLPVTTIQNDRYDYLDKEKSRQQELLSIYRRISAIRPSKSKSAYPMNVRMYSADYKKFPLIRQYLEILDSKRITVADFMNMIITNFEEKIFKFEPPEIQTQ